MGERAAIVTGGGTGIGRAAALALHRDGFNIVVAGRRPEPLEGTRELAGDGCVVHAGDIREPETAAALVDRCLGEFGRIDCLVNNAGGQFVAPAEEISAKGWRAVHRLAVDAAWELTRLVATRSMIPNGRGLVVFIGFSPRRGIPGMTHASAARAAVENMAASLSNEWARYGIRAVCVAPGNIMTEGLEGYGAEQVAQWEREVPLGRLGTPEEVAAVIAFLASAGGAYITGSTILVDGGVDAWGLATLPPRSA
jgi:citronellol/citronellal dehydrogenase